MSVFRSFLFAPANHPRRTEKVFSLGADVVILDLEDACELSEKIPSRAKVVDAMARPRSCLGYVRVNPLSTEFAFGDFCETVRPGLDGVILPKVDLPTDIQTADWLLRQLEREHDMPAGSVDLIPIIETAAGLVHLREIAATSARVKRVAFGAGDFTLDLGLTWSRDEVELRHFRSQIVLESRAAGIEPPIDTVWTDIKDSEGFFRSANAARNLGFQGKLCIYPDQVAMVNRAFTPTEEQCATAQRIVSAFAQAEASGSSAIQVDGKFIDYPIVYGAQRLLAIAEKINGKTSA